MKVDEGTASHVDAKTGKTKVVERGAVMVPDGKLLQRRTPRDQELALGPEEVAGVDALLANIHSIDEACFRDEPWGVVLIKRLQVELASRPFQIELVARSGQVSAIDI